MNILQMSLPAGILILLAAALRPFAINKLPGSTFTALWGMALLRLSIPLSIPAGFDIYHGITRFFDRTFVSHTKTVTLTTLNGLNQSTVTKVAGTPIPSQSFAAIWIIGASLLILFFAYSFLKHYRNIRTALPIKGNAAIDSWLSGHKLMRPIRVLVSDRISTPLTYGIIKPKIVLPKSMNIKNHQHLEYVLAHEYVHIKRFDALLKIVLILAVCFHWFNPMVWLLYVLMNRDLEIACDRAVIRKFGESARAGYAMTLIELAESHSGFTPLYSNFSKNTTEERITSIMKFRKTSLLYLVMGIMLIFGASTVFAEVYDKPDVTISGFIQTNSIDFFIASDENGVGDVAGKAIAGSDGRVVLVEGDKSQITIVQIFTTDIQQKRKIKLIYLYPVTTMTWKIQTG